MRVDMIPAPLPAIRDVATSVLDSVEGVFRFMAGTMIADDDDDVKRKREN